MPSWSFSEAPWYKMPWDGGDSKCWPRCWQPHMRFIYPLASVELQRALPGEQGWNPLHQDHFVTISAVWQRREWLPPQREVSNVLARGLHMLSHKFEHIFQKFTHFYFCFSSLKLSSPLSPVVQLSFMYSPGQKWLRRAWQDLKHCTETCWGGNLMWNL